MLKRIVLSTPVLARPSGMTWWIVPYLACLAGCGAGTKFHAAIEAGQWTPEISASALRLSSTKFNLATQGGIPNDEAFWYFDASFRLDTPRGGQVQPYTMSFGYWQHTYKGTGLGGVTFGGATIGPPITTTAEFKLYKFAYEEMRPTEGVGGGLTGGLLGLHYLEFDIKATDGTNVGVFGDGAPMLVVGWKINYASRGLIYYFGLEGMDLDTVSLNNVGGSIMDTYGGIRWCIRGNRTALSIGYRKYEVDLAIRNDRLSIDMDGLTVSLFLNW